MFSISFLRRFRDETDAAVTVDWIVLTASVVSIGLSVLIAIGATTNGVATKVDANMQKANSISDVVSDSAGGGNGGGGAPPDAGG